MCSGSVCVENGRQCGVRPSGVAYWNVDTVDPPAVARAAVVLAPCLTAAVPTAAAAADDDDASAAARCPLNSAPVAPHLTLL